MKKINLKPLWDNGCDALRVTSSLSMYFLKKKDGSGGNSKNPFKELFSLKYSEHEEDYKKWEFSGSGVLKSKVQDFIIDKAFDKGLIYNLFLTLKEIHDKFGFNYEFKSVLITKDGIQDIVKEINFKGLGAILPTEEDEKSSSLKMTENITKILNDYFEY
ncbi:MAG: hypothetical protein N4A44_03000 [Alphaproteobacteria bacterium]|jgi:hypothetical protein|nr:hypothetical protein [Alphaproteobacteria bacterium]